MKTPARSVRTDGSMIRRIRLKRGWTQQELGKAAGYSTRLIRKAESCGMIDIETLRNIAQALSTESELVSQQQLVMDIRSTAVAWMNALNRDGVKMVDSIRQYLTDDFVLYCPGDPATAPFIGTWHGASGLQKFFELYFTIFQRVPNEDIKYSVGEDLVIARYQEFAYVAGQLYGPVRVNMCFTFKDGLIQRIDDDYDIQGGVATKGEVDKSTAQHLEAVHTIMRCYDAGGRDMTEKCGSFFSDEFVFECPASKEHFPFGGTWTGATGMQQFCDAFYEFFSRTPNSLTPEYLTSNQRVIARFIDQFCYQENELPPQWVNFHFHFKNGLIVRIDDEFDHHSTKSSLDDLIDRLGQT